jgi:4-hydroxy-2-oxoheptanedioate aldolase
MDIAGLADFHFAIIETGHGEISSDRAVDMARAEKLAAINPRVKVYTKQPELIAKALEIGAEGAQILGFAARPRRSQR